RSVANKTLQRRRARTIRIWLLLMLGTFVPYALDKGSFNAANADRNRARLRILLPRRDEWSLGPTFLIATSPAPGRHRTPDVRWTRSHFPPVRSGSTRLS